MRRTLGAPLLAAGLIVAGGLSAEPPSPLPLPSIRPPSTEPPRVEVATDDAPTRGPRDAPVTIVEFSDFECPFCGRAAATVQQLLAHYGSKLRYVAFDFPLPIHPLAEKAAEAAACARAQGKYWEMHDRLFADQSKLSVADLKRTAASLGLDAQRFDACLDSGEQAAVWQAGLAEGKSVGVHATPAFFINGRLVLGAQPYQTFAQVIDDELARAAGRALR
jgi:protein-disulfide isomerase